MILKSGMKVLVKSLKWYNENKDRNGWILKGTHFCFSMSAFCGKVLTLKGKEVECEDGTGYIAEEDETQFVWHESFLLPVSNIYEEE